MTVDDRPAEAAVCAPPAAPPSHPVLHRWFVQYNPAYFASALCLLAGIFLVSNGLGGPERRSGELWLFGVVQLYEVMLIAGAGFLYRLLGQRRPAVILALVEMVYLLDPTFQTEVAAYLDDAGRWISAAWLAGFAIKLYALAWALRLRVPTRVIALAVAGAGCVAVMPQLGYARLLDRHGMVLLLAWAGFALGMAMWWLRPDIESRDSLDEWGELVLRRASRATAALWIALACAHGGFWVVANDLHSMALLLAVPVLLVTLWARHEGDVWFGAAVAVGIAIGFEPAAVSSVAAMTALVLLVRSRRGFERATPASAEPASTTAHPYRTAAPAGAPPPVPVAVACPRLGVGALACAYFAVWTLGWHHGGLPPHMLGLDLLASAGFLWLLGVARLPVAAVPLLALHGHRAVEAGWIPRTAGQWGAVLVVSAFALLLAGLAVSWWVRIRAPGPQPDS